MIIDLTQVFELSRRTVSPNSWNVLVRLGKLTEEVGEFAESTLVTNGYMHKELKEPQAGELADVIITAVDTWLQSNLLYDNQQAQEQVQYWLDTKFLKWAAKYPK